MRISGGSADVGSSDLRRDDAVGGGHEHLGPAKSTDEGEGIRADREQPQRRRDVAPGEIAEALMRDALLGRDHLIFLIPESVLTRPIELGTARRRNTGERDTGIAARNDREGTMRSEEHTSELQSLMRISYAGFC